MCGIAGIINKQKNALGVNQLIQLSKTIAHRGPDGEGFVLIDDGKAKPFLSDVNELNTSKELPFLSNEKIKSQEQKSFDVGLAHRRLSIIDLSALGHQPMSTKEGKYWITFNGEIYNYLELKEDLVKKGFSFFSNTDTEVVLNAYKHWGKNCLTKFNGMFAFVIIDLELNIAFAARDRIGVKPFYFINTDSYFAFASEQKAFVKSGLIKADVNNENLHTYFFNNVIEGGATNFFENVTELFPGKCLLYNLTHHKFSIETYFECNDLLSKKNKALSDNAIIKENKSLISDAIKLRLRSDVEVGTCLSGGIDSSVIACQMAKLIKQPINCFTAVFPNSAINEENFANQVAQQIKANHYKVEPNKTDFLSEINELVYSQDTPIWSTSTYAQHKVMWLAKQHKTKVVLDGQGADEVFAGYHHHYFALWKNQLKKGMLFGTIKSIHQSRISINNPFKFFVRDFIKGKYVTNKSVYLKFFKADFVNQFEINVLPQFPSLNKQLIDDIQTTRLKTFLKCEDRCSMWHGVESRTPFSDDINLLEFNFSYNGNRKIKEGVSKYFLREAMKGLLPESIYKRYDKQGFETPFIEWMKYLKPEMLQSISEAKFDFVNYTNLQSINLDSAIECSLFFKLYVFSIWKKVFES